MNKNIIINIAFNISNPLHDEILKISAEIKEKYNSDWYVDDKQFYLHLPVYLMAMPEKNKDELLKVSAEYAKLLKPVKVEVTGIMTSKNLVMIEFEKKNILYQYHLLALRHFNPLREGQIREKYQDERYIKKLENKDRKKIRRYGHPHVLENFHPHVTIARVDSEGIQEEIIKEYEPGIILKETTIEKLQVHHAMFEPENKNILLTDIKL